MVNQFIRIRRAALIVGISLIANVSKAQYKSYSLSDKGDTLNIVDNKGLKQGKWIITVPELRGEPGYDEEGIFKMERRLAPGAGITLRAT
jgi:hypothetical protein